MRRLEPVYANITHHFQNMDNRPQGPKATGRLRRSIEGHPDFIKLPDYIKEILYKEMNLYREGRPDVRRMRQIWRFLYCDDHLDPDDYPPLKLHPLRKHYACIGWNPPCCHIIEQEPS